MKQERYVGIVASGNPWSLQCLYPYGKQVTRYVYLGLVLTMNIALYPINIINYSCPDRRDVVPSHNPASEAAGKANGKTGK